MWKAFITNISFPKSLEEVLYFMKVRGKFDVEEILCANYVEWTSPKDAYIGQRVYFMHSKTSIDTIKRLKRELRDASNCFNTSDLEVLNTALNAAEDIYSKYGASIFATGIVCGDIVVDNIATTDGLHWRSRYYAPINSISLIKPPINISEFRDFISVSRTGAITKLNDEQDGMLCKLRQLD